MTCLQQWRVIQYSKIIVILINPLCLRVITGILSYFPKNVHNKNPGESASNKLSTKQARWIQMGKQKYNWKHKSMYSNENRKAGKPKAEQTKTEYLQHNKNTVEEQSWASEKSDTCVEPVLPFQNSILKTRTRCVAEQTTYQHYLWYWKTQKLNLREHAWANLRCQLMKQIPKQDKVA